ncbi:MAG TPA: hypothetical protein IAB55_00140 [Candidatus Merdivicinus faecavium]|nr:hypothetical protein [Candidatus Merdivicinus faecavium]
MNQKNAQLQKLVIAALLCAIGIIIPIFMPFKITLDPMSFTLASHVAVFVAMFVSPGVAVAVELGTTVGFLLAGFPPAVVLRALVQILFVVVGAYVLARKPGTLNSFAGMSVWVLGTGLLHAVAEALVSTWFYFGGSIDQSKGFFTTIILLVGVGTLAHHIVDFAISYIIWRPISKIIRIPASVHFGKAKS